MKVHLHSTSADVTLGAREAMIVRSGAIPMIYSPGGMGPEMPPADGGTVKFGGACYVNVGHNLRASLAAFRAALANAESVFQDVEDEQAGFSAFPAGRWMDAARGTKGRPSHVRCTFKNPRRVAAWTRGYEAARSVCLGEAP